MNEESIFMVGGTAVGAIILMVLFFHYVPFVLWLSAKVSGVRISLMQLFLMRIRNVPPSVIVQAMIEAHKAGLENITRDSLEAHYLAGGHVERVVHALASFLHCPSLWRGSSPDFSLIGSRVSWMTFRV